MHHIWCHISLRLDNHNSINIHKVILYILLCKVNYITQTILISLSKIVQSFWCVTIITRMVWLGFRIRSLRWCLRMGWSGPHQSGALRASSGWIWVIVYVTHGRKLSAYNSHSNHGDYYQLLSLNWALHIFRMWGARFKCLTNTIKIKWLYSLIVITL